MDMIAPGAIERILEDRILIGLNSEDSIRAINDLNAGLVDDVSAFRHTPFKDHGHGCILLMDSGEQYVITVRRMEEQ